MKEKPQLTQAALNRHIDLVHDIIDKACRQRGFSLDEPTADYYQSKLHDLWWSYRKTVLATDCSTLNEKEQADLQKRMIKAHKVASRTAYKILASSTYVARSTMEKLPNQGFGKVQAKQAKRYAMQKRPISLTSESSAGKTIAHKDLNFPKLSSVNAQVDRALKDLRTKWSAATRLSGISDDDQFLLEQIVTTYLPDSWQMYTNLSGLPETLIKQGANMLLAQVQALTARVDTIVTVTGDSALKELRAATHFIEQKRPAMQLAKNLHIN